MKPAFACAAHSLCGRQTHAISRCMQAASCHLQGQRLSRNLAPSARIKSNRNSYRTEQQGRSLLIVSYPAVRRLVYRALSTAYGYQLCWALSAHRLRILCYHGICEDALVSEPWMPHFFVACSAFEEQLEYLKRKACVLPLSEAADLLKQNKLPARAVSITFDDGYANNLHLAAPLLARFDTPATIFVCSSYIESGELFPFLKLKLVAGGDDTKVIPDYKSSPLDAVVSKLDGVWEHFRPRLTPVQYQALRPMTVHEVAQLDPKLIELGGHTHTHCILSNETVERRQNEIRTSVRKLAEWTGRRGYVFSYPNGQRGDFGEIDKRTLHDEGIRTAVAGIAGANTPQTDLLELRRYPIGLFHDEEALFSAEITGVRSSLTNLTRRVWA